MHSESFEKMRLFVDEYLSQYKNEKLIIGDLGSQNINGTYKDLFNVESWKYVGIDVIHGQNVDIVLNNPYEWKEIEDNFFDVIISGQAFEHIEFPWLTIKEVERVLKPNGLFCLIVPSKGPEHKAPYDCWRFYPDGIKALAKWVNLNVVEVFSEKNGIWGDTFAVLQKNNQKNSASKFTPNMEARNIYYKIKNNKYDFGLYENIKEVERRIPFITNNIYSLIRLSYLYLSLGYMGEAEQLYNKILNFQLQNKIPNRTTIIQHLINTFKFKTYLEIGVEKGDNFFQIKAPVKIGVDPNFEFDHSKFNFRKDILLYEATSDDFFSNIPKVVEREGLDIVFIDGLHTYEQSLRDVQNSLNFLNEKGIIVLHDCYPENKTEASPTYEEAKKNSDFNGSWRGEVYKTIINLRNRSDLFVCTIDCDCGIGVVFKGNPEKAFNYNMDIRKLQFADFLSDAPNFLNLKPATWIFDFPYSYYLSLYKKIAIFGLGKSGKMTYDFIKRYYPERIKYFIDDNVKGDYEGIPIVTTDEFLEKYQYEVDIVVFGKYQNLNPMLIPNLKINYLKLEYVV
jgi:SAM-dependent methyltransferase